jgi:hypothetical protein
MTYNPDDHPTPQQGAPVPALNPGLGLPLSQQASCPTCGSATTSGSFGSFVYAIGRIEVRYPRVSIEKELAQAVGRVGTQGLSNDEATRQALARPENRYIVRQLCWVLTIEGLETYLLEPRDPADLNLLIGSLRAAPRITDLDVVIGVKGLVAPPTYCNGLMVPVVGFTQIYSFDVDHLLRELPRPDHVDPERFKATSESLFHHISQTNTGATDRDRALNYLALRYPPIYEKVFEQFGQDYSLTAIEVRPSPLSVVRRIVEVIFFFTNGKTGFPDAFFIRVDVTEEFPFIVTKLRPYVGL